MCQGFFFNKVAGLRPIKKGDSGAGAFLLILSNF